MDDEDGPGGPQHMKAQNISVPETALYQPLQAYLTKQGYTVRSEVRNCDIAAVKGHSPSPSEGEGWGEGLIIIEMKRSLNVQLLVQAVQRQKIAPSVYVAVPRPANKRKWNVESRGVQHLLKRLELGLILVSTQKGRPPVEVVFHPVPFERQRRKSASRAVLQEIERRSTDLNQGGSCRRKLVTAYRENAINIACCLAERGQMSPKALRDMGTGDKTLSILYHNVYGWFERVDRGIYAISAKGRTEIEQFPELVRHYRALIEGIESPEG